MFLPHYDMVAFDFAGCGHSEGQFITLGYNEREDVYVVINRVRNEYGIKNIYLWGRSMGAATAIFYTAKYGGIKGIISDNSYSDLDVLINELSDDYLPFLPTFLLDGIINSIQ
jgi:pimeloyl-ACP methyl ester carboxylesterase